MDKANNIFPITMKSLLLIFTLITPLFTYGQPFTFIGKGQRNNKPFPKGNIRIQNTRSLKWNSESKQAQYIINHWATEPFKDWATEGKAFMPRKILANFMAGKDIEEMNIYIQGLKPWGNMGSKWFLHKNGDYDFTMNTLTTILFLFDDNPDILFPETKQHVLDVLLIADGNDFTEAVPRSLGLIKDTENHLLMGEGSRYLKNRYLMLHGNSSSIYNNEENGMEEHILTLLTEITDMGLYEFNSMPYLGYTIGALLNLEAFGSEKVRRAARNALDFINYSYALGNYKFKYYPPFRRRWSRAWVTSLSADYHTAYMKTWLSFLPGFEHLVVEHGKHHALIGACMPYRPSDEVIELIFNKKNGYFVKLGHGKKSSPEIYTAGTEYLISAGGVSRGKTTALVARPICLFIDDEAQDLAEVVHIKGKNEKFQKWNNTGVYKNFACSNGPVHIPEKYKPVYENKLWSVYTISDSLWVAVHSSKNLGIFTVAKGGEPAKLASELLKLNPDIKKLRTTFRYLNGDQIEYNVNAPRHKWIIKAINGKATDRLFDKWPLMEGEIY